MKKLVSFVVVLMLVAIWTNAVLGQRRSRVIIAGVAFQNQTGDSTLNVLSNTIPDQIITFLGRGGRLMIVERAAIERVHQELKHGLTEYVDPETRVKIGNEFGATAIIVGSFAKFSGNKIAINARLVSTETGLLMAAEPVVGAMNQMRALCEDIAIGFRNVLLEPPPKEPSPVYKKWWFWGGVAAAGAGAALVLSGGDSGPQFTDVIIDIRLP